MCGDVVVKRPYIERLLIQPNSTQFGKLNLILNHQTQNGGGRVDIIKRTHIVEKFFVIFNMKRLWLILTLLTILSCEKEKDCAGVEGGNNICGCNDIIATNYNKEATFDDGSCEYDLIPPQDITLYPIAYYNSSFHLYWSENTDSDFRGYYIYRDNGLIDSVLVANDTSYVLSNISKDIEVTFEVIATDSSWNFSKSETQIASSHELVVSTSEGNLYTINTKSIYADKNLKKIELFFNGKQLTVNSLVEFDDDGSKFLFGGHVEGNYDIWRVEPNGMNLVRLTTEGNEDRFPVYSPDGTKIVYSSMGDKSSSIYLMNYDGTAKVNLTNTNSVLYRHIKFSPDGNSLVFSSNKDGNYEIYTMNIDGSNLKQLTDLSDTNPNDSYPNYVLGGTKIIYQSYSKCGNHIRIMNVDGTDNKMLTDCFYSYPVVSPDGNQLVMIQGNVKLFTYNLITDEMKKITDPLNNTEYADFHPYYFQDGNKIIFVAKAQPNGRNIWMVNSDGTGRVQITNGYNNELPSWFEYPVVQPH